MPEVKQISEVDMCSILGNALDNAIEAQLKLPVNDRIIGISIQSDEDVLDIVIKMRLQNQSCNIRDWNTQVKKQ